MVKALLEHGAVDAELLRQAVTDQSVDAVFDLLRWQQGDFAFVVEEINPDDVGVTVSIEAILADAESRIGQLGERLADRAVAASALLSMPVVLPDDPQVSREEWSLLALVDGRRSVAELVDLTGSGHYAVVSTLAGMVDARPARGPRRRRGGPTTTSASSYVARACSPRWRARRSSRSAAQPAAHETAVAEAEARVRCAEPAPCRTRRSARTTAARSRRRPHLRRRRPDPEADPGLVTVASADSPIDLVGTHVPGDVVPPRAEPFLPKRQADFDERQPRRPRAAPCMVGRADRATVGSSEPTPSHSIPRRVAVIERDPNVNRSLMLRLIAGVRGL